MERAVKAVKVGWFNTPGRIGDRDLAKQMEGLAKLFAEVPGKTVLDAGCAEGLISIELAKAGAKSCLGLEVVAGHVEVGTELASAAHLPCEFLVSNLNEDDITMMDLKFDVVLMLAVLHKLKQPAKVCKDLAGLCKDLCVIRLPPSGLKIVDARSENVLQDIGKVMDEAGFDLEVQGRGPFDEYIGYFRRRHPVVIGVDLAAGKDQTVIVDVTGDQSVGVKRVWEDGKLVYSKEQAVEDQPKQSEAAFEQTEPVIVSTRRRRSRIVDESEGK